MPLGGQPILAGSVWENVENYWEIDLFSKRLESDWGNYVNLATEQNVK